ncbi:hypothetical protein PMAYCL1PPCAC_21637, partial [Pristionchus mayeri]
VALVEFHKSRLYDEFDFATGIVYVPLYCSEGCRIYASVPDASANIARNIFVDAFQDGQISLYEISDLSDGDLKGYYIIQVGNAQVNMINTNSGQTTAPIAVWIVRNDAENIQDGVVYEASKLSIKPNAIFLVTMMSADPFTLRTKTEGPLLWVTTLSGFDAITNIDDRYAYVYEHVDNPTASNIELNVHCPLLTTYFDEVDFMKTTTSITSNVGISKFQKS